MSNNPIPDTSKWQPRQIGTEDIRAAFQRRCSGVEQLVIERSRLERAMNVDNFDAGSGIEDLVRSEIDALLPGRYGVAAGVVNDRQGQSAGDVDCVIFSEFWFTPVKSGATKESRRVFLPIEGVYAVCEIKQTLSPKTLDDAMEKLVKCHRLHRPLTSPHRSTENRDGNACNTGLTNPLYSIVLATDLAPNVSFEELAGRFIRINQTLMRLDVVRSLCVLGHGTVTWGFFENGELRPALFMGDDLARSLSAIWHPWPQYQSALYPLLVDLNLHLFHSILAPEDIAVAYGPRDFPAKSADNPADTLKPDAEWIRRLRTTPS